MADLLPIRKFINVNTSGLPRYENPPPPPAPRTDVSEYLNLNFGMGNCRTTFAGKTFRAAAMRQRSTEIPVLDTPVTWRTKFINFIRIFKP